MFIIGGLSAVADEAEISFAQADEAFHCSSQLQ